MSPHPQVTLADLTALADSYAEQSVLYVDPDTGLLDVGPAAHVSHHLQVLQQAELVQAFGGTLDEDVAAQWANLDEDYSRDDVLEQLEDDLNANIARIRTEATRTDDAELH